LVAAELEPQKEQIVVSLSHLREPVELGQLVVDKVVLMLLVDKVVLVVLAVVVLFLVGLVHMVEVQEIKEDTVLLKEITAALVEVILAGIMLVAAVAAVLVAQDLVE
jgi:hypothetical protein